jgi:hypothetical protein
MSSVLSWCRSAMPMAIALLLTGPILASAQTTSNGPTAVRSGTIVSHIDSYGSGTGSRSELSSSGQMVTGFDYGDPAKPDWKGSIKWQLLRREGKSDVYQIEWNFKPTKGTSTSKTEELSFDGVTPSKLVVNTQWVISIEPVQPLANESKRERIGSTRGKDIYRGQLQDSPPSYTEVASGSVHLGPELFFLCEVSRLTGRMLLVDQLGVNGVDRASRDTPEITSFTT